METLLLIDGNALVHRAYHALPPFKTINGTPTNAVYGFVSTIHKIITDYKPTYLIVCFDSRAKTFRDKLFKEYRIQRPHADDELKSQFPIVKEFVDNAGIIQSEKDGYEADDLIACFAKKAAEKNLRTLILTGDKDLFQLVDEQTFVITPQLGFGKEKLFDIDAVKLKFGVKPGFIPDFKALAGDQSDNYKGVEGIGPKNAAELINNFGAVEDIYKSIDKIKNDNIKQKLIKGKKDAMLSKKLATLVSDIEVNIDLDSALFTGYNENVRDFFDKYEFVSLKNRIFKIPKVVVKKPIKQENKEQISLF